MCSIRPVHKCAGTAGSPIARLLRTFVSIADGSLADPESFLVIERSGRAVAATTQKYGFLCITIAVIFCMLRF
jgi:hypothetical protein